MRDARTLRTLALLESRIASAIGRHRSRRGRRRPDAGRVVQFSLLTRPLPSRTALDA
jgi:hypothetical protein